MDRKKELLVRVYAVLAAFIILSVVIMARVVKVSLVEGDKWREKGNKNVKLRTLRAERGNIYSEDFNLLSTSLKFFDIHMDLSVQKDKVFNEGVDSLAFYLSNSIGKHKTESEWRRSLINGREKIKNTFQLLKR